jgi:hypothetical protein
MCTVPYVLRTQKLNPKKGIKTKIGYRNFVPVTDKYIRYGTVSTRTGIAWVLITRYGMSLF